MSALEYVDKPFYIFYWQGKPKAYFLPKYILNKNYIDGRIEEHIYITGNNNTIRLTGFLLVLIPTYI